MFSTATFFCTERKKMWQWRTYKKFLKDRARLRCVSILKNRKGQRSCELPKRRKAETVGSLKGIEKQLFSR